MPRGIRKAVDAAVECKQFRFDFAGAINQQADLLLHTVDAHRNEREVMAYAGQQGSDAILKLIDTQRERGKPVVTAGGSAAGLEIPVRVHLVCDARSWSSGDPSRIDAHRSRCRCERGRRGQAQYAQSHSNQDGG